MEDLSDDDSEDPHGSDSEDEETDEDELDGLVNEVEIETTATRLRFSLRDSGPPLA